MSLKPNLRQQLKKGDNMVVTVEELADGCVIVSTVHQNRKFCGALMDTTERKGPYGIPNIHEVEHKMETRIHQQASKKCSKTPFPKPLLTRKSYNLEINQPPERNIYRRIRRSRRKARSNTIKSTKDTKSKELLDHDVLCDCENCSQWIQNKDNPSTSTTPIKRKAKDSVEVTGKSKKLKFQDDTPSTSSDNESDVNSVRVPKEIASPIKNLLPRKTRIPEPETQRSPVIKITFKSPGGRGRIVKIPSKLHSSPTKVQRSPLVKIRSSDQFQLQNSSKKLLKHKTAKHGNDSSISRKTEARLPLRGSKSIVKSKRKYVRKKLPTHTEQLPTNTRPSTVCVWDELNNAPVVVDASTSSCSRNGEQKISTSNKEKLISSKKKSSKKTNPLKKIHKKDKMEMGVKSVVEVKKLSFKNHSLTQRSESVIEVKKKSSAKKLSSLHAHESVVEVRQKGTKLVPSKSYRKEVQARKVLNRAKRPSLAVPLKPSPDLRLTNDIFSPKPSMASSPDRNKHLRVVLQPLEGKNGLSLGEISPRDSFIYHSFGPEKTTSSSQSSSPDNMHPLRKSQSPQSHTIYVTTCKGFKGTVFTQGDVVWGKLRGYPWWPSRIVKLIITKTDGKPSQKEAMVGWFRSPTTSIIPLHSVQSFQKHFDLRFDKKRKGVYQKAVGDAENALNEISPEVRKLISQFETS